MTVVLVAFAGALVAVGSRGIVFALAAVAAAAYVLALAVLGRDRMALLTMVAVFGTAPAYKGLAASPSDPVTPTDLLLVLAFALLLPTVFARRVQLPPLYIAGLLVVTLMGLIGSAFSPSPPWSLFGLAQLLVVMAVLPTVLAMWRPSAPWLMILAWSYVGGHLLSAGWALVDGPVAGDDRYAGLTHHPNAFAEAGMMAVALLLYLFHRHRSTTIRIGILVAGAISIHSVVISGSRAATVVVAVLILMVPVVERSAISGFVYAILGSLFIVALPLVVSVSGEGSAISRLAGTVDAAGADQQRAQARQIGWDTFAQHPFTGSGFLDVELIHDNFLEIAAATGIFGLFGFLMVMFTLARPIIGYGEQRRLCYAAWAYIGLGATVPGLQDRTLWIPAALAIVAAIEAMEMSRQPDRADRSSSTTAQSTAECHVGLAGRDQLTLPGRTRLAVDEGHRLLERHRLPQPEHDQHGVEQDQEVEAGAVALHRRAGVRRLELQPLGVGEHLATDQLRRTGEPGGREPAVVDVAVRLAEAVADVVGEGTRPDDAHLAAQDVDQLRQLGDAEPLEHPAEGRVEGRVGRRVEEPTALDGRLHAVGVDHHHAELRHGDDLTGTHPAPRAVEHRPAGRDERDSGGEEDDGDPGQGGQADHEEVERALPQDVTLPSIGSPAIDRSPQTTEWNCSAHPSTRPPPRRYGSQGKLSATVSRSAVGSRRAGPRTGRRTPPARTPARPGRGTPRPAPCADPRRP